MCRLSVFFLLMLSVLLSACGGGGGGGGDVGVAGGGGNINTSVSMPDTGQINCFNSVGIIDCFNNGQDGDFLINPPSYTDNLNGTISDDVTGLMWQKEDNDTIMNRIVAGEYCSQSQLGNHNDWRIPSLIELVGLVNYREEIRPAIDRAVFSGTNQEFYWTSEPSFNSQIMKVTFYSGAVRTQPDSFSAYTRCVRGSKTENALVDNGDGTIKDNSTGFMWEKFDSGLSLSWEESLTFCKNLDYPVGVHSDWRLPNIKELFSLFYANTDNILSNSGDIYWSSTTPPYFNQAKIAWVFDINGETTTRPKEFAINNVRCVR
jgi:hypothetical protein